MLAVLDHSIYNAQGSAHAGVPGWLKSLHSTWGSGREARPLLLVLLVVAVIVDYRSLHAVQDHLPPLPAGSADQPPRAPNATQSHGEHPTTPEERLARVAGDVLRVTASAAKTSIAELRLTLAGGRAGYTTWKTTIDFLRQRRALGYALRAGPEGQRHVNQTAEPIAEQHLALLRLIGGCVTLGRVVMAAIRLFRPTVAEGFEWIQPVDESDYDAVYQLDGSPAAAAWKPIRVRTLQADDRGHPLQPADLPWLGGHALVFRDRARRAAGDVLASSGEFLELDVADGSDRLWLYNVTCVADVLDEEASELVRFPSAGRVMKVKRHVFSADAVSGLVAFRVPQTRSLFIAGDAVDAMRDTGLSGVNFELVWDNEDAGSV